MLPAILAALLLAPPAAKAPPVRGRPAPAPARVAAFSPAVLELAPGETFPVELFVPSPTGKAFQGRLKYLAGKGLEVAADPRWKGQVPPWGAKTFPRVTATPAAAAGEISLVAELQGGGKATLTVRVAVPTAEPVPGERQLAVKVTNPFSSRPLFGRVRVSNPDRFLQDVTAREFKIAAGQVGEVLFPLPGAAPAEGETYDFTVRLETYQGYRFQRTYPLSFPTQTARRSPVQGVTRMSVAEKLKEMGLELPVVNPGKLAPAVRTGNLVYTSGSTSKITGKVGGAVTVEQGYTAAREAILGCLASAQWLVGDLGKVTRVVKILGMVNCAEGFSNTPAVIHGATDTLVELFGKERGWHARSAIGVYQLPGDAAVEIELIVEVQD